MTAPIRTDSKDVDMISLDIVNLLSHILFNNNLVCEPCLSHILDSFHQRITYVQFSAVLIKGI